MNRFTLDFYKKNKHRFNVTFITQTNDYFDYVETSELFDSRIQAEEYAKQSIRVGGNYEDSNYHIRTLEEDYAHLYEETVSS